MTTGYTDFGDLGLIPQNDGHPLRWSNCAAASEAMRTTASLLGIRPPHGTPWYPTAGRIRDLTGDTSGGITAHQASKASFHEYGVESDIRIITRRELARLLRERYTVTVLLSYGPINATLSGSPGFRGNHSLVLNGIRGKAPYREARSCDPLYDGRRSEIPKGPQWIDFNVITRAASELGLGPRTTLEEQYGPDAVYVNVATQPYDEPTKPITLHRRATALKRPRRLRVLYDRTVIRSGPSKRARVLRVVPKGHLFPAWQKVKRRNGVWVGNRDGTRWLFKPGAVFGEWI